MEVVLTFDEWFKDPDTGEIIPLIRLNPRCFIPDVFQFFARDYGKSPMEMIIAGKYDGVYLEPFSGSPDLDETNPGDFEAKYFPLVARSSIEVVRQIRHLDKHRPWEPAKIGHMRIFGALCPEEQLNRRIVGLGSVTGSGQNRLVPILSSTPSTPPKRRFFDLISTSGTPARRYLSTTLQDGFWTSEYQALMVRPLVQ